MQTMRHYFNNGMMVINTEQFNQTISVKKLLETINNTHWHLADQTIPNILLEGRVQFLPWRYITNMTSATYTIPIIIGILNLFSRLLTTILTF